MTGASSSGKAACRHGSGMPEGGVGEYFMPVYSPCEYFREYFVFTGRGAPTRVPSHAGGKQAGMQSHIFDIWKTL
ncbi:hypothetical protein NJLHNGOC_04545 [Novacetimonas cocois]|uniref:Uncharacterized protein n=1 Tax=Novacetimonas cocois TaxID=1747507 RepID=A0A365YZ32_9PROT|nr:hypothetical protein NJLHNGOC_04545 [Novacetimonas cocois]